MVCKKPGRKIKSKGTGRGLGANSPGNLGTGRKKGGRKNR